MKKSILLSLVAMAAAMLTSCEKDLPLYDDTQAYLNFRYANTSDSTINYSFVFSGGKQQDTVWVTMLTMGFLSDQTRTFELQQIPTGQNDAVAGRHYVALDDERIKPFLKIDAGATSTQVPVILLRDASLDEQTVKLKLAVKDNGTFKPGYKERLYKTISLTAMLSKPQEWTTFADYYFGTWGPVKHQFMIDVTGEKWDDEYIKSVINDYGYVSFLISKLNKALSEENARRLAAGEGYMQEKDGTLVTFGW